MKQLLEQHYKLIVERGMITPMTTTKDFMEKLGEEISELSNEYANDIRDGVRFPSEEFLNESCDVVMVLLNMLSHLNVDFEKLLQANIDIQKQRI